jgi:hypothetical protein
LPENYSLGRIFSHINPFRNNKNSPERASQMHGEEHDFEKISAAEATKMKQIGR